MLKQNKMKDTILLSIGCLILSYVITSFALWEIDPLKWLVGGRIGFVSLTVVFYVFVQLAIDKELEETNEK